MDVRWLKILMERGRFTPEVEALRRPNAFLQQVRTGRFRIKKYKRVQDLLKLPRNPTEEAARQDLLVVLGEESKVAVLVEKRIAGRLKNSPSAHSIYSRRRRAAGRLGRM